MARVALYLRVSSKDQEDSYSLPVQELLLRDWCAHNGHDVVATYIDPGHKSDTLDRPELNNVFMHAKRGEFDVLAVIKYDRFSRVESQHRAAVYQLQKY